MSENSIKMLRTAFNEKNLTLFLGAGVSIGSRLPSWEKLVLSMYFNKISQEKLGGWRPFSNYLYAIAEWHLKNSTEPLEVTARKLRKHYGKNDQQFFLEDLYTSLYGNYLTKDGLPDQQINIDFLRDNNGTLKSIAKLCESQKRGVKAVVTYNYDSLLELALINTPYQSIFKNIEREENKLPIYHVHGYVPLIDPLSGSESEKIVFTEDQYHLVAENHYNWSNLVQLQLLSNTTGLMVGLSLSDRNMRRLLDAVRNSPINSMNYAILEEPATKPPDNEVLDQIHQKAIEYLDEFAKSGIKKDYSYDGIFHSGAGVKSSYPAIKSSRPAEKGPRYREEIAGIIEQVKLISKEQQEYVLKEMGIIPIWYKHKHYDEIPKIIGKILE